MPYGIIMPSENVLNRGHKPSPYEYKMPCHYGKNCLLFLFFCIYTDNRIFAFFVLVYQLVNFLKLLFSIFTCFHCDSFLHFSLYKTMLLQKLLYHMWRYIPVSYTHLTLPTKRIV